MTYRTDAAKPAWRKSSHSTGGNQCVEVAVLTDGHVAVRDSKNPRAGSRAFSPAAWDRFVRAVKKGHA